METMTSPDPILIHSGSFPNPATNEIFKSFDFYGVGRLANFKSSKRGASAVKK
jgi:hypothetical protein